MAVTAGLPERAEVAIVGGGVMGASIAYHLASRGVRDVVLIERDRLAGGPTGRSTALIRLHYSQPLLVRMAAHGLRTYAAFRDVLGTSSGFTRTGLLVAAAAGDRAALERNVAAGRGEGAVMELLDAEQVSELNPMIRTDEVAFAYEPEAGHCDPFRVTAGFFRASSARLAQATVTSVADGGVVDTTGGRLAAGTLVVAAGPWTAPLLRPLGYELPIRSARTEVGRFRVPPAFESTLPALADFSDQQIYFVPHGDVLEVGSLDPGHAERPIDPDECPEGAERATLEAFRSALATRVVGLGDGVWRGSWSAVYDVTPDWHPAIGFVPGADRIVVAAGFSGHGFKLAPAVGAAVAELVCDGRASTYDLSLLDPERFARGELVQTTYGYSVLG